MISSYIPGIYNYLILPRQVCSVERGLFTPQDPTKSLVRLHQRDAINTGSDFITPTYIDQKLSLKLDMTKILEGHLGVRVVWQPFDVPEPEDANQITIDIFEAELCFFPVVGRLASNCFGLFMDIANKSDAFKEANPFEMSGYLLADRETSSATSSLGLLFADMMDLVENHPIDEPSDTSSDLVFLIFEFNLRMTIRCDRRYP